MYNSVWVVVAMVAMVAEDVVAMVTEDVVAMVARVVLVVAMALEQPRG